MSFEQMKAITEKALEDTKETVAYFNDAPANVKDNLRNKLRNSLNKLYMSYDNREDRFIVNDTLPKLELYNFQLNQEIYKNGTSISKAYEENGIEASHQYVKVENTLSTATKKLSFKDAFLKYADMITKNQFTPQLTALEREQPLIREAYYKLGTDKVRSLRYIKKSVENALISLETDQTTEQRIARIITNVIPTQDTITVADANRIIKEAYQQLGIAHKAKAKELHKWYECSEPKGKRIDGKVVKVVEIYREKFIFDN